jgi:hypothetical protein
VLTPPPAPANGNQQQTLMDISSQDDQTKEMRLTFEIATYMYRALWYAEITIYNPNLQTIRMINTGAEVSLSVGYVSQGGTLAEIFRGKVFQPFFERDDAANTSLKLLCFTGLKELIDNMVKVQLGPLATQRQIVLEMAKKAMNGPIPIAYLAPDSDFSVGALPRSTTIFGKPSHLFAQVASANEMALFFAPDGLHMGKLKRSDANPDITYAPPLTDSIPVNPLDPHSPDVSRTLLGTPTQTDGGVDFRVLLDPRLILKLPPMQVKLQQVVIQQSPFQYKSILTQDGVYFPVGVTHVGDSRGNTWESLVTALSSINGVAALLATSKG